MDIRTFKDKIYSELASISKAMGNPNRLEIIELLAQGPCSVEYIVSNTGLSVANASQHLQTLKSSRLVTSRKEGKYRFYSLANQNVYRVWSAMRELGISQNAEIGKLMSDFRESRHNLESLTTTQLLKRMENEDILILDVRPREEYESGHINTALSIPQNELIQKMKELPSDKEIVAYCRGPFCAMADDAVLMLQDHGYQASKLDAGFPDWKEAGHPVAQY
ncbi:MAG: ArsR family transcriptional regulator [Balneolaceae bacterium]|nr:ArsR family transcriptional regulator [Balneolaceae bacterium]MCH8550253.1 metalloregulator ArsR/SmtB family transcription factor [Balneolaceae bacterium]